MPRHKQLGPNILEAALAGLEAQRQRIEQQMAEVSKLLGSRRAKIHAPAKNETAPKPRRKMTAAARKRIAAAQKRRWAEFHKKHGEKK